MVGIGKEDDRRSEKNESKQSVLTHRRRADVQMYIYKRIQTFTGRGGSEGRGRGRQTPRGKKQIDKRELRKERQKAENGREREDRVPHQLSHGL